MKEDIEMEDKVPFDIKVDDIDLSFINELVNGGISNDTSSLVGLVGDVSFNDDSIYKSDNVSDKEANSYLQSLGVEPIF